MMGSYLDKGLKAVYAIAIAAVLIAALHPQSIPGTKPETVAQPAQPAQPVQPIQPTQPVPAPSPVVPAVPAVPALQQLQGLTLDQRIELCRQWGGTSGYQDECYFKPQQ
jgi:hypothetical protein